MGLKAAVATIPVSAYADATNWKFYRSGVFSNCATNVA